MEKKLKLLLLAAVLAIAGTTLRADLITAYSPDEADSVPYHGRNCLGFSVLRSVEGLPQAATDHRVYPAGSILQIGAPFHARVIATDCGSGVRGRHVDLCQRDREAVRTFPTGRADVRVIRLGWGPSGVAYSSKRAVCALSPPGPVVHVATIHERQSTKRAWA